MSEDPRPPIAREPVDDPRVYLAAERTYLAWVRTSLGLMGFGFIIARFGFLMRELEAAGPSHVHGHPKVSAYLGGAILGLGIAVCVWSVFRHRAYVQALRRGVKNPDLGLSPTILLAAVLTIVGLVMAIQILTS